MFTRRILTLAATLIMALGYNPDNRGRRKHRHRRQPQISSRTVGLDSAAMGGRPLEPSRRATL